MGKGVLQLKGHRDQGPRLCRARPGEAARWRLPPQRPRCA